MIVYVSIFVLRSQEAMTLGLVSMMVGTLVSIPLWYKICKRMNNSKRFFVIGSLCILFGLIPSCRFLFFYLAGEGTGHIQSLIMAAVFFIVGFQVLILGLLGDVISQNRKLIEETLLRVRRIEFDVEKNNNNKGIGSDVSLKN